MIAFTMDIDWAPEEVIEDALSLFKKNNIKCTLFSTHQSDVIQSSDLSLFEIAIHPNFNPLFSCESKRKAEEILDELLTLYPDAKGVRSHSMTQSTPLLKLFKEKGLIYDSNQFLPYDYSMKPYLSWDGLIRIPYSWEDDVHFLYKKSFDYEIFDTYHPDNLYVLDFHPIHVYLNTDSEKTYLTAKPYYHDFKKLSSKVNYTEIGTRDFLKNTFEFINKSGMETYNLFELTRLL
jgi:hypothetical protein